MKMTTRVFASFLILISFTSEINSQDIKWQNVLQISTGPNPAEVVNGTAKILIIDPTGRKSGFDIAKGTFFDEIPIGCIDERIDDIETGEPGSEDLMCYLNKSTDGVYKVILIGTAFGDYYLDVFAYDDIGNQPTSQKLSGTTCPGKVDNYEITYSSAPGSQVEVKFVSSSEIPVFDGKGQRPTDVNKFLQYFNPTKARTMLPGGTQDFNLSIIYGNTIKRKTFVAVINKNDITSQFDPLPGKGEIVKIPLKEGRNTLLLSIEGLRKDGRTAKDRDKLVFIVQPE